MARRRKPIQLYEVELVSADDPLAKEFPDLRAYEYGDCRVLRGLSKTKGTYLAISCNKRWPTTKEIIEIRNLLVARSLEMAVMIPIDPDPGDFTLHIHQVQYPKLEVVRDEVGRVLGTQRTNWEGPPD
jgi:hypothetical protein